MFSYNFLIDFIFADELLNFKLLIYENGQLIA
jgi:hypothetical protein